MDMERKNQLIALIIIIIIITGISVYKGWLRPFSTSSEWKNEGLVMSSENYNIQNPEITDLENGCWMIYTHGWTKEDESRNDIYAFSSCDGTEWKPEGRVLETASMPAAVRLPDGKIRLYFIRNTENTSGMMSAISENGLEFAVEEGYRFVIGGGESRDLRYFIPYYAVKGEGDPKDIRHMAHLSIAKLDEGGYRIYFDEAGMRADPAKYGEKAWPLWRIRSISSRDGLSWKLDPGVRIDIEQPPLVDMQRAGSSSVIRVGDEYRMYFFAGFSPLEDLNPYKRWEWSGTYMAASKDGLNFSIADKRLVLGGDVTVARAGNVLRMYVSEGPLMRVGKNNVHLYTQISL